jgi:uncharacterized protein YyaL (SSP411 family)
MIKGLASAGRRLNRPELVDSAQRALDFVQRKLWQNGRLLAVYKDGQANLQAYLDDYAFLLEAAIELLQTRWRDADLAFASALADGLIQHFEDPERGGFFFTANDHEGLIHRPKSFADDAIPSGNGIACFALNRLGHLLGETRYTDAARRTLAAAWPQLDRTPYAYTSLLNALEEYLRPPKVIVLRGETAEMQDCHALCNRDFAPRRLSVAIPTEGGELPGTLAERKPRGRWVAYVCSDGACLPPIETRSELESRI